MPTYVVEAIIILTRIARIISNLVVSFVNVTDLSLKVPSEERQRFLITKWCDGGNEVDDDYAEPSVPRKLLHRRKSS